MLDIFKQLGDNIRQVRKIRRMTMDDVADAVSEMFGIALSDSLIGAWERGERRISADHLYMLAEVLGCSVHTLYGIRSDVRVQAGILSEHERSIVEYLFNEWPGDTHAMIEFCGMYMASNRQTRHRMADACLGIYHEAWDHGMTPSADYVVHTKYINEKCTDLVK